MNDDLPLLRASLAPEYAGLPAAQLSDLLRAIYGPGTQAEDVEGLFDDIGRGLRNAARGTANFASKAAPMIGKALPAMASGAMAGSAVGPWGTAIGAAAGLTGGLLSQSRNRAASGIGRGIGGAANLVSTVRGGGTTGALGSLSAIGTGIMGQHPAARSLAGAMGPGTSTAAPANALMALLGRHELARAMTSAALGSLGARSVAIGRQQVPVSQILAALGVLGQRAAHEASDFEDHPERTPAYAEVAERELGIDADDAEGRTDALLTLLALTPSLWLGRAPQPISVNVTHPPAHGGYDVGERFWLSEHHEWDDEELDDEWTGDWAHEGENVDEVYHDA